MIGWVIRIFISREANVVLRIYNTLIRPHILYCTPAWSSVSRHGILRVIFVTYPQSRQSRISINRMHLCKHIYDQKTSNTCVWADYVGWQTEKCVGVMKIYIHSDSQSYGQSQSYTRRFARGSEGASEWPACASGVERCSGTRLRSFFQRSRDARAWIWNNSVVKKLWVTREVPRLSSSPYLCCSRPHLQTSSDSFEKYEEECHSLIIFMTK